MNQKWKFLIILIFFLVIIIYFYMEKKDTENIGNIMEAIPTIDSVVAKDSNTKEKILKLTNTDSSFDYNMIDIYDVPFIKLKKSERKLLREDRKSTRLNSSHVAITYAVFCLKKKKDKKKITVR